MHNCGPMVNELIERILDLVPIVERESPFPKGATFHEIEALCRAAREFHLDKDFPFLRVQPETWGNEHRVWFHGDRVFKSTYPNCFGLLPGKGNARPTQYLRRIELVNRIFGDSIRLEGIWIQNRGSVSVVTSQDYVVGDPAPIERIEELLVDHGFIRSKRGTDWFFRHAHGEIWIGDLHTKNVLLTAANELVVIDVLIAETKKR